MGSPSLSTYFIAQLGSPFLFTYLSLSQCGSVSFPLISHPVSAVRLRLLPAYLIAQLGSPPLLAYFVAQLGFHPLFPYLSLRRCVSVSFSLISHLVGVTPSPFSLSIAQSARLRPSFAYLSPSRRTSIKPMISWSQQRLQKSVCTDAK